MKIQKKPSPETETASWSYIWNKRRCATRWSAANAASSPGMAVANMSHPSMTLSRRGSTAPANHGQASTQRRKDPHRPRKKVSCLAEISACPISSSWSISWTDPWTCFAGEAKAWIECKEITSFATIRLKELTLWENNVCLCYLLIISNFCLCYQLVLISGFYKNPIKHCSVCWNHCSAEDSN